MSLTSYRAAPPRVLKVRRLRLILTSTNRVAVCRSAGATAKRLRPYDVSVVMPEQNPMGFVPVRDAPLFQVHRHSFCSAFRPLESRKDRFGRPFCFGLGRFRSEKIYVAISRPGSDRLSRVLRRSTIGAGAFHGRVRNGNGCSRPAITTRSAKRNFEKLVRPVRPRFSLEHALASSV